METKSAIVALAALAQGTRLQIFRLLVEAGPEGQPVGTIVDSLGVAPATMSFHLKELVNADLVSARQDGRFIYYSASFDRINDLLAFLTQNCCARSGGRCGPASSDCAQPRASKAAAKHKRNVAPPGVVPKMVAAKRS